MKLSEVKSMFQNEISCTYSNSEIHELFSIFCLNFLDIDKIEIRNYLDKKITHADFQNFSNAVSELKTGKPFQHILGETEFFGMKFFVNKHVLIPRPETEELLELAIFKLQDGLKVSNTNLKIIDIGTGSGVIPIVLKKHFDNASITAIDFSEKALSVAVQNANYHQVKINFKESDYLNQNLNHIYDVIISNPPYIGIDESMEIENSVKDFEPKMALFSPTSDPLIFYKKIAEDCIKHLYHGGFVFLEINQKLGIPTLELFKNLLSEVKLVKDISGNNRFIVGKK